LISSNFLIRKVLLTFAQGFLHLLAACNVVSDMDGTNVHSGLSLVAEETQRLEKMVNEMLDFLGGLKVEK
jgi:hypothetical protein